MLRSCAFINILLSFCKECFNSTIFLIDYAKLGTHQLGKGGSYAVARDSFDQELSELKQLIEKMGKKAMLALHEAIEALVTQDINRALHVIDKDYKINRIDQEINEKAIWMIAKQQPVAIDLRRVIASIKISTDLERVGDLAVNIAKSTIRIGDKALVKPLYDIPQIAEKATSMLEEVMKAFDENDVELAQKVADMDNELDEMFGEFVKELLSISAENSEATSQVTQLAFVCRDLERVGDHVTNICENIVYIFRGELYNFNA